MLKCPYCGCTTFVTIKDMFSDYEYVSSTGNKAKVISRHKCLVCLQTWVEWQDSKGKRQKKSRRRVL
jgi:hypothetical protein